MTIAKELAWEETNGEENQIEFLEYLFNFILL